MTEKSHYHPGSAMSSESVEYLEWILGRRRHERAIEFGPGYSSIILSRHVSELTCIDSPSKHHDKWRRHMSELGLQPTIYSVPPLADHSYDLSGVQLDGPYDLVLIDGPWEHRGRWTDSIREVYQEVIGSHTTVVVDDTHRSGERKIVALAESLVDRATVKEIWDGRYPKRSTTFVWRTVD